MTHPHRHGRASTRPSTSFFTCCQDVDARHKAGHDESEIVAAGITRRALMGMGTKSRETIYGASIRASAKRAVEARKQADRLACEAWNQRMLGYKGRKTTHGASGSWRGIDNAPGVP